MEAMTNEQDNVVQFGGRREQTLMARAQLRAARGDLKALALVKARREGAELTEEGRAFFRAQGLL